MRPFSKDLVTVNDTVTLTKECKLPLLSPGAKGKVVCVDCGEEFGPRLQEMGFVPGTTVEVVHAGCPLLVKVGDSRFCLRHEQAQGIQVLPD